MKEGDFMSLTLPWIIKEVLHERKNFGPPYPLAYRSVCLSGVFRLLRLPYPQFHHRAAVWQLVFAASANVALHLSVVVALTTLGSLSPVVDNQRPPLRNG